MNILADSSLPFLTETFPSPFRISGYQSKEELMDKLPHHDILICRSTLNVDRCLLANSSLRYIATASSGVDHIDKNSLKQQGIDLFDAKGSNAAAVADYVLATIAYLMTQGSFHAKTAGIIGAGKVGTQVSQRLEALKLKVFLYDPPKAARDSQFKSASFSDILACDLLCIHANLHDNHPHATRHLFAEKELQSLANNCIIINAARGDIVKEEALLGCPQSVIYCTDVFSNEPRIHRGIVDFSHLCTPHIAGHSIDAKRQAMIQISQQIHQAYQLSYPLYPASQKINPFDIEKPSWQEQLLSLYNPIDETRCLKSSNVLEETFINLRKNHPTRYDLRWI